MPRTADPSSPAKRKLLDAAERLMLEKGFTATTVDDICAVAGLTKGSFFHYFENKDELGKAVLEHTTGKQLKMFETAPYAKLANPLERVFGRVDFIIQMSPKMFRNPDLRGGCLIGNLAQELAYTHSDIRSQCADCLAEVSKGLELDLAAAKKKHAPKSSIDPHGLAELFVAIGQGSNILAKARQSETIVAENMGHFRRYLQVLFKK
jgi:TetR/AcrR family transcriptional repressor of nem operon